jgi:urease accessory protein
MRLRRSKITLLEAIAFVATVPAVAFAHHAMGGRTPATLLDGLFSGLAHPVIELPHLAAILVTGIVAARLGRPAWIALFVAGSFIGTAARVLDFPLSPSEALVSSTPLLLAAFLLLRLPAPEPWGAIALLAVGVVHGVAFAESIVAAEPTPIVGYLVGLASAELGLAGIAAAATQSLLRARVARTE